jgi:hypothetical protein
MDADDNLRRQLAIARAAIHVRGAESTLVELSALVLELADWLDLGGVLPRRWMAASNNR